MKNQCTFAACNGNHYDDPTSLYVDTKRDKATVTVIGRAEGGEDLDKGMFQLGMTNLCEL